MKLKFLKKIHDSLNNPNQDSLILSMANTHHEGIFSLVIEGTEFGNLTRIFIVNETIKPFAVQLHTHRYPIKLTILNGDIKHHIASRTDIENSESVILSEYEYKSPLNDGDGLKYIKESSVIVKDYNLPIGSTIQMSNEEFHTISCSAGSIWIVEELGFVTKSSRVLGIPFVTNEFYNKPNSSEIYDYCQLVAEVIKKMIHNYELVK